MILDANILTQYWCFFHAGLQFYQQKEAVETFKASPPGAPFFQASILRER